MDFSHYYDWFKVGHILSFTAWMAGMFYLPRLFVYHTEVKAGGDEDKRFQLMEMRLQRIIMNPAMIFTIFFGLVLSYYYNLDGTEGWYHIKLTLVFLLAGMHGFLAVCRKRFIRGENKFSANFYRVINEIPTVLFVFIVIMIILKPFED